ncbi:MAG TPA: cupredoxin domain-containing protein [Acidimicrobiia bacterium]
MRRMKGPSVAFLLAVLVAACSSDGASTEINAEMTDFQFSPTSWTVPAGEEITIELTNNGSVEHEFVILQPGVTISGEDELPATEEELLAEFVYWEDEVEAGETKTVTFTAPPAGEYQVICAIEGHFTAGMEGTLTSESA